MPVSGPGMNYYGGDRPGDNLFSNATVALDAQTGKLKWHFQNIRHEIWDYNLPPAPGLIDIRKDGKTIPALAQVGKSGFMFILNRENGTPVHGIEERPQAKADVPGEWYPATQPIPRKPGPLARVSMTRNDLVTADDTTPAHAEACRALWDKVQFRNDGPYTPWNYRPSGGPPSIVFPGMTGGVNWGGTATDPELGYIFVNSKDEPSTGWIAPNPRYNEKTKDTEFPYVHQSGGTLSADARDADGRSLGTLPCFRPPWASLMAVNAATGEFVWRVPLGVNDSMPEGKKNVGSPGYGGPIVTAGGLVFIGATRDRRFRAFDSQDRQGTVVGSFRLQRHRDSNHLPGPERQAVCRRHGRDERTGQQRVAARVRVAVDRRGYVMQKLQRPLDVLKGQESPYQRSQVSPTPFKTSRSRGARARDAATSEAKPGRSEAQPRQVSDHTWDERGDPKYGHACEIAGANLRDAAHFLTVPILICLS